MSSITITTINERDVPEIRSLGIATPELQIGNAEPDYYTEDMLRSFITSPHDIYLAARAGDVLAGYFLASYNPYLKEAYLIDVVVKPEFRNQGILNLFLAHTLDKLKTNGCVWAWGLVHEDNAKMMQILEKKGFNKGRKFTFFYKVKPF